MRILVVVVFLLAGLSIFFWTTKGKWPATQPEAVFLDAQDIGVGSCRNGHIDVQVEDIWYRDLGRREAVNVNLTVRNRTNVTLEVEPYLTVHGAESSLFFWEDPQEPRPLAPHDRLAFHFENTYNPPIDGWTRFEVRYRVILDEQPMIHARCSVAGDGLPQAMLP